MAFVIDDVRLHDKGLYVRRALLFVALFVLCSKIAIPLYPIPITMQMFAVYFLGLVLEPMESFAITNGWLFLGLAGLPVFASAGGLCGPSSGYIFGMCLAAPAAGIILRRSGSRLLSCVCAYLIVHLFGFVVLSSFVGLDDAMRFGIYPFVLPELFKMTLACAMSIKLKLG
jgi:biotin transporter BioY